MPTANPAAILAGIIAAVMIPACQPSRFTSLSEWNNAVPDHPYVGMWVTADGRIRHELLPNDRYDEARDGRASLYQGRYVITGDHIDYVDDTGFTADGEFRNGILYHAGMVLTRKE